MPQGGINIGAIARNGYVFEIDYSVINQTGAVHVYKDGEIIKEIDYQFAGKKPNEQQFEDVIEDFLNKT